RSEQKVTLTRNILGSTAAVLIPAKRRNADIITALDVLYSGAYRRLPSVLRETFEDYKTITDEQVVTTLNQLNDAILYRLRLHEIVPVPMSQYRVCDGRAWFAAPGLFEVALTVTGPEETDYWYALDMKFLVEADGNDADAVADFPSDPHPWLKGQIISNLNEQLALNSDLDLDIGDPFEEAPRRKLRDPSKIDTPLVRAYNMLQTLSLSYELEILYQQAMRQLKLGWQDVMTVVMEPNRKSFVVEYWRRQPQAGPSLVSQPREGHPAMRPETAPLLGGTLTFSIVSNASTSSSSSSSSASQPHVANVLSLLEQKIKSAGEQMTQTRTPTDSEEPMQLRVEWKPIMTALAIPVLQADMDLDLRVDPSKVDFNALMRSVTRTHSQAILRAVHLQLVKPGQKTVFSSEDVELTEDNDTWGCALRIRLCPSQTALLSVDPRTGKITMKDIGVFAAANRSGKFLSVVKYVNKFPGLLVGVIRVLKFETIFFELEQQARYLGLHATKNIN
ncbi:mediator complex subunit, partial [Tulasnella sp. 403]